MKKVNEVSKLVGVTKRTLQYYDDEGLLPVRRSKENYRLYDDDAVQKIWEILFFKEMGFDLSEIKEIILLPKPHKEKVLNQRIEVMSKKLISLQAQICFVEKMKECGLPPICFNESDNFMTYFEFISVFKNLFSSSGCNDDCCYNKTDVKKQKEIKISKEFREWMQQNCQEETYNCLIKLLKNYFDKIMRRI